MSDPIQGDDAVVATKGDVRAIEASVTASLRAEMATMGAALRREMAELRLERPGETAARMGALSAEMRELRSESKSLFAALRADIDATDELHSAQFDELKRVLNRRAPPGGAEVGRRAASAPPGKVIGNRLYVYQSEFAKKYYAQGYDEGRLEGLANAVLSLCDARRIAITSEDRERVLSCKDEATLSTWLPRAATAVARDTVFGA